jgi:hypothetical protein
MPEPGRVGLGERLRNLYRASTPVVRTCLFAGTGMGLLLGLFLALGVPEGTGREAFLAQIRLRSVLLTVVGMALLGALVGLAVGVALQLAFAEGRRGAKDKPWWKSGKSSRRKG